MKRMQTIVLCILLGVLLLPGAALADAAPRAQEAALASPDAYMRALEIAVTEHYGLSNVWTPALQHAMDMARGFAEQGGVAVSEDASVEIEACLDELLETYGSVFGWPYELHAVHSAMRLFSGNDSGWDYAMLPGEGDVQEAEAFEIARKAVRETCGLTEAEVQSLPGYSRFVDENSEYATGYWFVVLGLNDQGFERYWALVSSPDGEVLNAAENTGNG